jgi:hypothetical protein
MRKPSNTSIILMLCLNGFAATINAQSSRRFEIAVPFQFEVAGQTLAAGKYAVERVDPSKPNLLMLRNIDNGVLRLVFTQRVEREEPSKTSRFVFMRTEGKYYLSQVWTIGDKNGNQLPADHEMEIRSQDARPAFVQLKTRKESP